MRTEAIERDVEIRTKLVGGPLVPICFSDEARQLAEHVWKLRKAPQAFLPFPNFAGTNVRLREMIDDEPLALEPAHELGRRREVFRIDKDVIGELEIFQHRDSAA